MTEDSSPEIKELEKIYGTANSSGFGSAVFYEVVPESQSIAEIAIKHYRDFIGAKWNAETESEWLSGWKNVYVREKGKSPNILIELNEINDQEAKNSIPLLTETISNAEQGRKALSAVFDDSKVTKLTVNLVGDGAALSGIIVTGIFNKNTVCSVVCLMD